MSIKKTLVTEQPQFRIETGTAGQKIVMVLEEDESTRFQLDSLLRNAGYDVAQAQSPHEALFKVSMQRPLAVLISLGAPMHWKLQFFSDLKSSPVLAGIPVIMLVPAESREETLRELEKFLEERKQLAPPEATIPKPIDEINLLEQIRNISHQ